MQWIVKIQTLNDPDFSNNRTVKRVVKNVSNVIGAVLLIFWKNRTIVFMFRSAHTT